MRTHQRWYHKHRDAIGFDGHRFFCVRYRDHHCLSICCLPAVSSIRILHFPSSGFEYSISQPNFNTTQTKCSAGLGHRSGQYVLWCGARTPMKALRETSTRTCRCRRVLGKRVTHARTHAQAQEQATTCNLGRRAVFANCLSVGSPTDALLGFFLLFGLEVISVAAFGVRRGLLSDLPTVTLTR